MPVPRPVKTSQISPCRITYYLTWINFRVDKFLRVVTSKIFAWINFRERPIKPIFAWIYFREVEVSFSSNPILVCTCLLVCLFVCDSIFPKSKAYSSNLHGLPTIFNRICSLNFAFFIL